MNLDTVRVFAWRSPRDGKFWQAREWAKL